MRLIFPFLLILIIYVSKPDINPFDRELEAATTRQENNDTKSDTTVYMVVQAPPQFPGGSVALFRFIQSASKFPVSFSRTRDTQTIFLKLLIEKDGSISNIAVAFSAAKGQLEQEAKRIVSAMPKWKSGSQDGRVLRVNLMMPIHFKTVK